MKNQSKEQLLKKNQQLQSKLIESETILKLLIESTKNTISLHDKNGRCTYYNGTSSYALNKEQVLGKMPSDIFDKTAAKKIILGIKEAFNSGKSSQYETVLDCEGEPKTFLEKIYPIFKDKTVIAAAKICNDITTTKNMKDEITKNAQNLLRITENTSDYIMLLDLNLNITFLNKTVSKNTNKSDVLGKSVLDFTPRKYHDLIKEKFDYVKNKAKPTSYQTEYHDSKNKIHYFEVRISPLVEYGKVIGIISISNNINEQKKAELKLRETKEKFYTSFYKNPLPMQIFNIKTGEKLEANKSFLKLTEYSLKEYKKTNLYTNNIAHDKEKLKKIIVKIKKEGIFTEEPFKIVSKSGKEIPTLLSVAKLNIKNKNLVILSYSDVTKRTKVLEELRLAKNYLEKLTNSMADIVFSVKMPERKIEWVNKSIITMGYKPNECIGKETSFLFPNQNSFINYGTKVNEALLNKKEFLHIKQKLIKKNGESFEADITTSFIFKKNKVISVTSIIRDISSQIKKQKELEKYKNHLEELVAKRTRELKEKNDTLDESLKVFVGREQKIKKLEEQLQEFKKTQAVN